MKSIRNHILRKQQHAAASQRRGTVTVEMAVVSPIIFLVFFGAIEMLNLNHLRNMASDAAFQAARKAVLPGADGNAVVNDAKSVLTTCGVRDGIVSIEYVDDTVVRATCRISVDQNSWGLTKFTPGVVLTRTCEFSREKPSSDGLAGTIYTTSTNTGTSGNSGNSSGNNSSGNNSGGNSSSGNNSGGNNSSGNNSGGNNSGGNNSGGNNSGGGGGYGGGGGGYGGGGGGYGGGGGGYGGGGGGYGGGGGGYGGGGGGYGGGGGGYGGGG